MSRSPTFPEAILSVIQSAVADIRISAQVEVQSYDPVKQMVSVQPLNKEARFDESGNRLIERLPQINNIPVQFPSGGGHRITFPIAKGDTGMLVFSDRSLDKWLTTGGEVDPEFDHRFSLTDAFFIPGIRDFAHPITDVPTDATALGKDGGATVYITDTEIRLGDNHPANLQAVALAQKVLDEINDIRSKHDLHIHAVTSAPGSTAVPTVPMGASTADVGSSIAKAKV